MDEREPTEFGKELRRRREATGIKVRELARRAGISEGLWRQYENGYRMAAAKTPVAVKPSATNAANAARVVDWSVRDAVLLAGFSEHEAEAQQALHDAIRLRKQAERSDLVATAERLRKAQAELALIETSGDGGSNPVITAIEADPYLLPEAKAHFLNQYDLLRRVTSEATHEGLAYVARGQAEATLDPAREAELAERATNAAKVNYRDRPKPKRLT